MFELHILIMNKAFKFLFYFTIVVPFISFLSCKRDNNAVPDVYTDIYLYTTDPAFSPLNATTGYTYLLGGSKGVLVYCKSQTEFIAYDRHCPYQVAEGNMVTVDASGLIAVDAVCGSKFLMTDGSPNSGPALNSLKQFQITFDGTVLHIFN